MTLEQASDERFKRGRKEYGGKEWRGARGSEEAREEIQDAYAYLALERTCLLRGRDPDDGDAFSTRETTTLAVIDRLLANLRETYTGLGLLSGILDDERSHAWEPLKFV